METLKDLLQDHKIRRNRSQQHLEHLNRILPKALKEMFKEKAPVAQVLSFRHGVLIVQTDSSVAASELRLRTARIVEALHHMSPEISIERIIWRF
jgi:hypothetical protein